MCPPMFDWQMVCIRQARGYHKPCRFPRQDLLWSQDETYESSRFINIPTPERSGACGVNPVGVRRNLGAVNRWIRAPVHFDAVADFDKMVRDPRQPEMLLPTRGSGDHPGYRAMAGAGSLGGFHP